MEISNNQLIALLKDQAELAATAISIRHGTIKPFLSKSEAYRTYSRTNVDRWLKEGLIKPIKDGTTSAKWRLDRLELEAVSKVSNRPSYKTVNERL
jgi:hypothetical protein